MINNFETAAMTRLFQSLTEETDEILKKCAAKRPEATDLEIQKYTLNTTIQSMEALKHSLSIMNASRLPLNDVNHEFVSLAKVCCTAARMLRVLTLQYCESNGLDLPTLRRVADQDIKADRVINSLSDLQTYENVYRELYPDTPAERPLLSILYDSIDTGHVS